MNINIFKNQQELVQSTTLYFIKIAHESIAEKGTFNVALAGGNSPKKLYELLSTDEYKNQVDWRNVYFFFGDERCVPADDPQSNARMVQESLFSPLKIAESQIFKTDTTLSPFEAAKQYHKTMLAHFNQQPIRFDLMLLGLGDNAHTASLFPFSSVLDDTSASVQAVFLKDQNSYRITMTAPLINQSKHIAFLVYGLEKAEAVYHVLIDDRNTEKFPAQLVKPITGELQWFLDEAAASLLEC